MGLEWFVSDNMRVMVCIARKDATQIKGREGSMVASNMVGEGVGEGGTKHF